MNRIPTMPSFKSMYARHARNNLNFAYRITIAFGITIAGLISCFFIDVIAMTLGINIADSFTIPVLVAVLVCATVIAVQSPEPNPKNKFLIGMLVMIVVGGAALVVGLFLKQFLAASLVLTMWAAWSIHLYHGYCSLAAGEH